MRGPFVVRTCEKVKENRANALFREAKRIKKREVDERAKPQRQAEP